MTITKWYPTYKQIKGQVSQQKFHNIRDELIKHY